MAESHPGGAPEPFELSVLDDLPDVVVEIVEAVHDLGASPIDVATGHMEEANALHAQMIDALSHGDVDAAVALNAQAEATLQAGVDHLQDPNFHATHLGEPHFGDPTPE